MTLYSTTCCGVVRNKAGRSKLPGRCPQCAHEAPSPDVGPQLWTRVDL